MPRSRLMACSHFVSEVYQNTNELPEGNPRIETPTNCHGLPEPEEDDAPQGIPADDVPEAGLRRVSYEVDMDSCWERVARCERGSEAQDYRERQSVQECRNTKTSKATIKKDKTKSDWQGFKNR